MSEHEQLRTAIGINAIVGNKERQVVRLQFFQEGGGTIGIELPVSAAAGLTVGLLSALPQLADPNAREGLVQTFSLAETQPFVGPSGQVGLELRMVEGLRIAVQFPKAAIQALKNATARLEKMSKKPPRQPPTH